MSTGNRLAATTFILKYLKEIMPKGKTVDYYKERFEKMSDADFDAFMKRLGTQEEFLVLYAPNFSEAGISVERNLAIGKQLGHDFEQRLYIGAKGNRLGYLTPIKYLVVDLPVRRVSQLLKKKIRVPEHTHTIDALTGQVTGDSRGAKVSYPELQILAAMGLDESITELIKYRGGDLRGHSAMTSMINRYGQASLKTLANFASGVESTKTLKTFLTSMHLKANLD